MDKLIDLLLDIRERYDFWERWYFENDEAFIEELKDFPDRFYDALVEISFYQDDGTVDEALELLYDLINEE